MSEEQENRWPMSDEPKRWPSPRPLIPLIAGRRRGLPMRQWTVTLKLRVLMGATYTQDRLHREIMHALEAQKYDLASVEDTSHEALLVAANAILGAWYESRGEIMQDLSTLGYAFRDMDLVGTQEADDLLALLVDLRRREYDVLVRDYLALLGTDDRSATVGWQVILDTHPEQGAQKMVAELYTRTLLGDPTLWATFHPRLDAFLRRWGRVY